MISAGQLLARRDGRLRVGEGGELVRINMIFKIFIIMIIMTIFMIKLFTTAMKVVDKDDANDSKYDSNRHDHHGCDNILNDPPLMITARLSKERNPLIKGSTSAR